MIGSVEEIDKQWRVPLERLHSAPPPSHASAGPANKRLLRSGPEAPRPPR